jgi:proliferating cell nuclear antigen
MRTVQGGVIRSLFDALKDTIHDVNLRFDPTGMRIVTMDNAKCALVHLKLHADAFEEYVCVGTHDIGINVANTFKLIRAAGGHDSISFTYDQTSPHELGISIQNFARNSSTNFALKLIDLDADDIEMQDVDFDSIITMPSVYFQRICRDMSDISDTMRIQNENGVITLGCEGDFASQKTIIGETESGMSITTTSEAKYDGEYSLKYLTAFCKSSNLCPSVEIYLRENYPLVLRYGVASLGSLKYCLMASSS